MVHIYLMHYDDKVIDLMSHWLVASYKLHQGGSLSSHFHDPVRPCIGQTKSSCQGSDAFWGFN